MCHFYSITSEYLHDDKLRKNWTNVSFESWVVLQAYVNVNVKKNINLIINKNKYKFNELFVEWEVNVLVQYFVPNIK